jgi:hypothetical protein
VSARKKTQKDTVRASAYAQMRMINFHAAPPNRDGKTPDILSCLTNEGIFYPVKIVVVVVCALTFARFCIRRERHDHDL